jgi:hypothetical protein
MLQESKYKEARIIGKALSTSGNMKYNMELIQAQNNQTLNINLPPNTSLGQNNQVVPNQGYQWTNPSNPSDLRVIPLGVNYATLPPYDLNYLQREYGVFQGKWVNLGSTLNVLFTYNWVSDINGDGSLVFNEFNNIKRTFKIGEPIGFAFKFIAKCGTVIVSKKDIGDNISFLIQIFNNSNGELIASKGYSFHDGGGYVRFENRVIHESLGKDFAPGKYLIAVSITSSDRINSHTITSLREYFEVIE